MQIAKALRILAKKTPNLISKENKIDKQINGIISREFLTPLEETRLAIEEIVIAKSIAIDLLPRPAAIRKKQHELIYHYQLVGVTVGKDDNKRLRIFPNNLNDELPQELPK